MAWKLILLALAAILVASFAAVGRQSAGSVRQVQPAARQNPAQAPARAAAGTAAAGAAYETAQVLRVIDGDTIELADGRRLRYIGIDSPEIVDPRKPPQCFGAEARDFDRQLVEGKTVKLERDVSNYDKYGRLLRYVWLGGAFVNLEMVREGYAKAFAYPPDVKYMAEFAAAESEAAKKKLGLWGKCH